MSLRRIDTGVDIPPDSVADLHGDGVTMNEWDALCLLSIMGMDPIFDDERGNDE